MKVYQMKIANEDTNLPSNYEIQKIAFKRGLLRTKQQVDSFKRLEAGVQGEDEFLELLNQFGRNHWVVLRNTWFNYFGDFECDFILITRYGIYTFEVKNYYGTFVYKNGECFSRNVPISSNPIHQARRATMNLKAITQKYSKTIPVEGALVFIGRHNQIQIMDEVEDIEILASNDVYAFIEKIKEAEDNYSYHPIDAQKVIQHFETYETHNPFPAVPYTDEELGNVLNGICCARCQSNQVRQDGSYMKCDCGLHEPREEAVIRTICEYGVLTFDRPFTFRKVKKFLDHKTSTVYLRNLLVKHFGQKLNGRYTFYFNNILPYERMFSRFKLTKDKIIYSSNRIINIIRAEQAQ